MQSFGEELDGASEQGRTSNFGVIPGGPELVAAIHAAIEEGGEPAALLRRCVEALVPRYADGCELDLHDDRGILRIVAGVDSTAAARRQDAPVPENVADHPIVAILAGGPARLLDVANPEHERLFGSPDEPTSARALGMTTAVLAPVWANRRVVGSLGLGRGPSGRRFEAVDVETAIDLGRRIGMAWHNAVLLAERASIVASLHDGLIVSDAVGAVLEVNERWCLLSGFSADECVGARMPYPWWPTPEEDADALAAAGAAAAEALRAGRVERRVVFRRADRSPFPALVSVAPVVDRATGEQRALAASIKDLTSWEATRADLTSLQRMTAGLAAARSVADVAKVTVAEAVARFGADAAFVLGLAPDGQQLELLASAGWIASRIDDRQFRVDRLVPASEVVRDGATVVVSGRDELQSRFPDLAPQAAELGVQAIAAVPVRIGPGTRAALSVWTTRPQPFDAPALELLEAMAAQCGQALRRAEGYDVEHRTSQILQRRLLSDVPVLHERATVASRYQPADITMAVGGDWYDVVHLGPDRLALVVGDVVGSGIDAAAVMGQLRSALKGIALVSSEPVVVLEALDRLARGTAGASAATVCYVLVDLAAGRAEVARAGHPPPLLISRDGACFVEAPADPPLGYARAARRTSTLDIETGHDVLFLYTDGLIERRENPLDERFDLLRDAAEKARRGVLEDLVDDVLVACAHGAPRRDDLAVLAMRDEPAGPDRFRTLVPALAQELSGMRHALRDFLFERAVAERVVDDVVLAASEAATNAVEHAYRDAFVGGGLMSVVATIDDAIVHVEVRDAGRWKAEPSATVRGRGLTITRAVMEEVIVRTGASGTTVSMSHPGAWSTEP